MIPAVFAERRQRVRDAMGPDAVAIFLGARGVPRSRDTEFPFRQDSDFWYLTGFEHPNAVAVLRTDDGPAFTLYVEPRAFVAWAALGRVHVGREDFEEAELVCEQALKLVAESLSVSNCDTDGVGDSMVPRVVRNWVQPVKSPVSKSGLMSAARAGETKPSRARR